jgi:hypothetical protein
MGVLHCSSQVAGSVVQLNCSVSALPANSTRTYATAPHSGTADTVDYCSAARRMVSTLSKPLSIQEVVIARRPIQRDDPGI